MKHDKYLDQFAKHMLEVDELAQVVLKGHLILEEGLTRILKLHVWNGEHVDDAGLGFYRKVQLARAFALRKSKLGMWDLLLAINALRNGLSHSLDSADREKKLDALKRIYLREAEGMESIEGHETAPDHEIVFAACAFCAGFLGTYEKDAESYRGLIGTMDRIMNPEKQGEKKS